MPKIPMLTSALPPLLPESIFDMDTGELIEPEQFEESLAKLVAFTQQESVRLWNENKNTLEAALKSITAKSPAEVGRQANLKADLVSLPRDVKVKSRIERLIRYQIVTSAKSFFESSIETKKEPTFSPYLNLGAIDNAMVILKQVEDKLELLFKCWDKEYLLTFSIPAYILSRDIIKFTLPVIKPWDNNWGFLFSIQEKPLAVQPNPKYIMGIDLGRVEPYTLIVANAMTGSRLAQYTATPRLRHLIAKRDRLNDEIKYLAIKANTHKVLGIPRNEILQLERERTRAKRNRILNKITWLIATEIDKATIKWSPQYVAIEDLSWVSPKHGVSRWTHSKDQQAITHKLTRNGRITIKVNPRNTSQECHKCGNTIKHIKGKRLVVCDNCVLTFDRDINAAMNIALRPLRKRSKGNSPTLKREAIVNDHSDKRLLTVNTS
jgi:transposase